MERKAKSKTETGNEMMSNNITYTYTSYTYTIPIPVYNTVIFIIKCALLGKKILIVKQSYTFSQ